MKPASLIITTLALAFGAAAPAAADQRLEARFHHDAFEIEGEQFPAAEDTLTYWFGAGVARMDIGQRMSAILLSGENRLYLLHHEQKTYSEHRLPVTDATQVVGPQLGPAVNQWAVPDDAIGDVRPREPRGEYLGYTCRHTDIEISIPLLDYQIDWCDSDELPIDYAAFRSLLGVRAILMHGAPWMLVAAQRLGGFPLYSEVMNFGMGTRFRMTEELTSIREQAAPKGHYEPPSDYRRTRYLELVPGGWQGDRRE